MSKAKELARVVLSTYTWPVHEFLRELANAVLSEPEPELKGFIEVTYTAHYDIIELIPIHQYRVARFDDRCAVIPISDTDNSANVYMVKESYDEIKQKIKESQ